MTTTQRTTKSPTTRQTAPDPTRRAATIVGWLFVVTYVTSISAKVGFYPPLFDGNYVTGPGEDSRVLWGAFAECILIIANIGTATALYTVVKHRYPNLGLSFIAARIMESVFIGVGILAVLTVVTLRQDYAAADDQSAAGLAAVGNGFLAMQEWTFNLGPAFVVGVGNGCILGWMMWRTGLVPRRLAMFGLVGGPLIIATGSAAVLGLIEAGGTVQVLSAAPRVHLGARPRHLPHRQGLQDPQRQHPPPDRAGPGLNLRTGAVMIAVEGSPRGCRCSCRRPCLGVRVS